MTEQQVQLDYIIMEEANVKKLIRTIGSFEPEIRMILDKGASEYYFTVGDDIVEFSKTTQEAIKNKVFKYT